MTGRDSRSPMRVAKWLLTGGTGFVGSALARRLAETGAEYVKAVRGTGGVGAVHIGEINGSTCWAEALQGVDVVVHLAARVHVMDETASDPLSEFRNVNTAGTSRLAQQAAEAGVRRLVLVSSIKVNGEATYGKAFTESGAARPQDPYGISKAEAEEALWSVCTETGLEGVVIRPPLVYGPGVGGNFERLMGLVAKGLPLPLGWVDNRRSLVARDNLVDLILTAATHPDAAGHTFLAADGEDLSTPELIRRIARCMERPARLLPVPLSLLRAGGRLVGKSDLIDRLCGDLQVDGSHARDVLGWTPPVSVDEELSRTVKAWMNAKNL